jgi:hypothetical protein
MAADIPDEDLAGTRAALAPTLAATAAVLPWLVKERPPRFDTALNQRWIGAARELARTWSTRPANASGVVRQVVFALYGVALDSHDADCLALGEALASATDRLEGGPPPAHLIAAMSATIECFDEATGLEHEAFALRARHFAHRLTAAVEQPAHQRSSLIDHLFAAEVGERLQLMREALNALPPDAVMLKSEATQIAEQAELIELFGLMDQARQLAGRINATTDLEHPATRAVIESDLKRLGEGIAAVDSL